MNDEFNETHLPSRISERSPKKERGKGTFFDKVKEFLPFFKKEIPSDLTLNWPHSIAIGAGSSFNHSRIAQFAQPITKRNG